MSETNKYGFMRVAAFSPRLRLAAPDANASEIIRLVKEAAARQTAVAVFPELSVCGYTCADLFGQQLLLEACEDAICKIANETAKTGVLVAVGAPLRSAGRLFNCAVLIKDGRILAAVPKTYLPNSAEFYEMRWFSPSTQATSSVISIRGVDVPFGTKQLLRLGDAVIGVEICQDLWVPVPPSSYAALAGANVILNLSASNEALCKHDYRKSLVSATSARLNAAYVYSSSGYGESTTDLVWAGSSLIYENGSLLAENERFSRESTVIYSDIDLQKLDAMRAKDPNFLDLFGEGRGNCFTTVDAGNPPDTDFDSLLLRDIEAHPFVPGGNPEALAARCREILDIQVLGLCTRLEHIGCKTAVIGISGGLDSTLALLVTVLAFDKLGWSRSRIIGVTMPGFGTTGRTRSNADRLMERLGISSRVVSIVESATQHLKDIGHDLEVHDTTYENAQARERTQILMDVAGETGGIVVGTGDLSELALGWCTYNGDHMSMYGVNASVPKTLVRTLVRFAADSHFGDCQEVLYDIVDTPISPELLPAAKDGSILQVTEDLVGPYELHDFFLYHAMRFGCQPRKILMMAGKAFSGVYDNATIAKWLKVFFKRFFSQQFKRSCMPDGPKVGSVSLSPRGDWRMPSDALSGLWTDNIQ